MPLIPVAQAAEADPRLRAVRFAMKDGSKKVTVLVSNPALENIELSPADRDPSFGTFKHYRKSFERIAPMAAYASARSRCRRGRQLAWGTASRAT